MPQLAYNKQASFDYTILDTFETGLVLYGHEVKSAKAGHVTLKGAYVTISAQGVPHLLNMHISPYPQAGPLPGYEPTRTRTLLLHEKEIQTLRNKSEQTGLTIVPLALYTKGTKIKLQIALAQGKKKFDKRRTIKERDEKRTVARLLRSKQR